MAMPRFTGHPSISVIGRSAPELSTGVPCFRAYGESDDPFRLALLIVDKLAPMGNSELAQRCRAPLRHWRAFTEDLREFLSTVNPQPSGYVAGFVDPDVLHPGELTPSQRWDDADFNQERGDLFGIVKVAAARGGWILVRCAPSSNVGGALDEFESRSAEPEGPGNRLIPELRPVLDWLISQEVFNEKQARRMVEAAPSGVPSTLFEAAYDEIQPQAREAAWRLSVLRPEQPFDARHLGPFAMDAQTSERSIDSAAVAQLREAGFLQEGGANTLVLPTRLRLFLRARAELRMAGELRELHRWLAREMDGSTVERQAEAHYHAVSSGDRELALDHSRCYRNGLRRLALQRDRMGQYREAADLYTLVVEGAPEDAFAWGHLGACLLLAHPNPSEDIANKILHAFTEANHHAPRNPIYEGWLLGFRVRSGSGSHREIMNALNWYGRHLGDDAVVCFSEPVLQGLYSSSLPDAGFIEEFCFSAPILKALKSSNLHDKKSANKFVGQMEGLAAKFRSGNPGITSQLGELAAKFRIANPEVTSLGASAGARSEPFV